MRFWFDKSVGVAIGLWHFFHVGENMYTREAYINGLEYNANTISATGTI